MKHGVLRHHPHSRQENGSQLVVTGKQEGEAAVLIEVRFLQLLVKLLGHFRE
jgi:hypothetical protein